MGNLRVKNFIKQHMDTCLGIISLVAFLVVAFFVFKYNVLSEGNGMESIKLKGKGIMKDPYRVESLEDYLLLSRELGQKGNIYERAYVVLLVDVELSGGNEEACLGNSNNDSFFKGTFEAGGHTISGLNIKAADGALFPHLEGSVRNLNLVDCYFEGDKASGIASTLSETGSIINCFVNVTVSGEKAAQLVSNDRGRIENCYCIGNLAVYENNDDSRGDNVYVETAGKIYKVSVSALDENAALQEISLEKPAFINSLKENLKLLIPGEKICDWRSEEEAFKVSERGADIPQRIGIKVSLSDTDRYLNAFFSWEERRWYAALPEYCVATEYELEIQNCEGKIERKKYRAIDNVISLEVSGEPFEIQILPFEDMPFVTIDFYDKELSLEDFYADKNFETMGEAAVYEPTGQRTGGSSDVLFSGRGNDSYRVKKRGFSLKLPGEYSLAGLAGHNEYNLIAGYRYDSLLTYVFTRDMYKELELEYPHDYKLVNLYVDGEFLGLYFLTEKMEIGEKGFDIHDLQAETQRVNYGMLYDYALVEENGSGRDARTVYYDIPNNPADITGGYLLEVTMDDIKDYSSRFITDRDTVYSSKNRYLSQKELYYIRDFVQDFENAVSSETGYNDKGNYYGDYIDFDSFADQWILYELAADISNVNSVYYFKDSDRLGDGKLHGVWPWDVERNYAMPQNADIHFLMRKVERGKKGDFWTYLMSHDDFRAFICKKWKEKYMPLLNAKLGEESGEKSILSIEDYRKQYSSSYYINEKYWDEIDYENKCQELETFLKKRVNCLSEYFD